MSIFSSLLILVTVNVMDIYESKELWRGPESIYRKEGVLALSGDNTVFMVLHNRRSNTNLIHFCVKKAKTTEN